MKTKLIVMLSVLVSTPFLGILPSTARQPRGECSAYVVFDRNDTYANLRSSPNGQVLQKIPNGAKASFIRQTGDWILASFDGYLAESGPGYIKSNLLRTDNTYTVLDTQDTYVNLRSSPNGKVLRKVTNGTPITIIPNTEANGWVRVQLEIDNQPIGYMSSDRIAAPSC